MWLKQQEILQLNLILLLLLLSSCTLGAPSSQQPARGTPLSPTQTPRLTPHATPAASPITAPLSRPWQAQEIHDGMGGTLLLDPDMPVPIPPERMSTYRVAAPPEPSLSEVKRWAQAWNLVMPWVGKSLMTTSPRFIAVGRQGQAVLLHPTRVTYRRLWARPAPSKGDGMGLEHAFRPLLRPPLTGVRLQTVAVGPLVKWYRAQPLLDNVPVEVNPPWGMGEVRTPEGVSMVEAHPFVPIPTGTALRPESFTAFLAGLKREPARHPLARYIRPLVGSETGHLPLARRPSTLVWRNGLAVEVAGKAWVYEGGENGSEVRAWLLSPEGTFELWPVSSLLLALAKEGEVLVQGTLAQVVPAARKAVLHVEEVSPSPPAVTYRGTLLVEDNTVLLHTDEGESILLPGAPLTLASGTQVFVTGHRRDGTFVWDDIYMDVPPPDRPATIAAQATRSILRVEPAYWLIWNTDTSSSTPPEGRLVPVWRVTTRIAQLEEILIYPMEGKTRPQ